MAALGQANVVRCQTAIMKDLTGQRKLDIMEVLEHPATQGYKLVEILRAVPTMGRMKIHKLLGEIDASESRHVRDVTDRQKRIIRERLREKKLLLAETDVRH